MRPESVSLLILPWDGRDRSTHLLVVGNGGILCCIALSQVYCEEEEEKE